MRTTARKGQYTGGTQFCLPEASTQPVPDPEERSRGQGCGEGGLLVPCSSSFPSSFHCGEPVALGQNSHFLPLSDSLPSAKLLTTSNRAKTPAYRGNRSVPVYDVTTSHFHQLPAVPGIPGIALVHAWGSPCRPFCVLLDVRLRSRQLTGG